MANRSEIDETIISSRPAIDYTIRFQNTGTDTAFNIVVLDTLSEYLDMSTFEFLSSSHPVQIEYNNQRRLLHFNFNNILLPDSNTNEVLSHGIINFRIKPTSSIQYGDAIANAANIYFDFNSAVRTNTSLIPITRITGLENNHPKSSLFIYPNPSKDLIWVRIPESYRNSSIRIYNQLGSIIKELNTNGDSVQNISTNDFPSGFFILRLSNQNESISSILIIE